MQSDRALASIISKIYDKTKKSGAHCSESFLAVAFAAMPPQLLVYGVPIVVRCKSTPKGTEKDKEDFLSFSLLFDSYLTACQKPLTWTFLTATIEPSAMHLAR